MASNNPFTRFWRYLKALLNGKLDQYEDPEVIINEAVREARENQVKNRELAVQAITQKNNLQNEVDKERRTVAEMERKAMVALQGGNRELAKQFLKEKAVHEQTLQSMEANLQSAMESSEKVKAAIKMEDDRLRMKTAEALALKANLKQAQIQVKINKALDQFQFSENEQQWTSAKERITNLQSEAAARAEVAGTSIDSRLREMEMSQMDVDADRQLAEMELKMSNNPAAAYTTPVVQQVQTVGTGGNGTAADPNIDKALSELEAKMQNQGSGGAIP